MSKYFNFDSEPSAIYRSNRDRGGMRKRGEGKGKKNMKVARKEYRGKEMEGEEKRGDELCMYVLCVFVIVVCIKCI